MEVKSKHLHDYLVKAKLTTQKDVSLLRVNEDTPDGSVIIKGWRNMKHMPLDQVLSGPDYQPLLPPGQNNHINHVIIYPGAFNPPHRGHVDTLLDGFQNDNLHSSSLCNKGPAINIVAAIVAPTGDDRLRSKEAARNETVNVQDQVMLSQKDRVSLFKGHLQGKDNLKEVARKTKMWKFPYLDPFEGYMEEVKRLAGLDGFKIEFLSLKGPDHLFFKKPIMHPTYPNCKTIMFTEATRRASEDCWGEDGRPKKLMGAWSPWSNIGRVRGRDGVVWESTLASPEGSAVRLLTDASKTRKTETSSTKIRNLIKNKDGLEYESLVQGLKEAGVFSPETLLEFHWGNPRRGNTRRGSPQRGSPQSVNTRRETSQSGSPQSGNQLRGNAQRGNAQRGNAQRGNAHRGNVRRGNNSQPLQRPTH